MLILKRKTTRMKRMRLRNNQRFVGKIEVLAKVKVILINGLDIEGVGVSTEGYERVV